MKKTWILIANASQARLFQAHRSQPELELLEAFSHPESRQKVLELISGSSGRYRTTGSIPGGIYEEPTSPKEVEMQRFAQLLSSKLNEGRTKNLYDELVLIAPSHFHGLLNKYCNTLVKSRVVHALNKDYTHLKTHQLPKYLNGLRKIIYKAA